MKKVIIVSYYWPPAGGIGVLRCLKLAKYLVRNGWEPVVFTSTPDAYEFQDDSNGVDVPPNIEVIRIKAFNPIKVFKLFSGRKPDVPLLDIMATPVAKNKWKDSIGIWIRGNFFIPDARAFWIKPATRRIKKWLESNECSAILSDGPPHTNTVVANNIAEAFQIPWLADFQDPWTQVDYYEHMRIGRRAHRIHERLEKRVFQTAKAITIASPTWAKELETIGAKNVEVLYYGFDESDFENWQPQDAPNPTIFHGGLLGNDRNPVPMIQALKELKQEGKGIENLSIRLAGGVSEAVSNNIIEAGFQSELQLLGMISRREVLNEIARASVLLLPINVAGNCRGRIPGKLFELIRSGKPILALGPKDGDVAELLRRTGAGCTFEYDDVDGVKNFLQDCFLNRVTFAPKPEISAQDLSNEKGGEQVAQILNRICGFAI